MAIHRLLAVIAIMAAAAAATPAMTDEEQKIRNVTIIFKNSCKTPLWPLPPNSELLPGAEKNFSVTNDATDTVSAVWFWAKVGCKTSSATDCDSGECKYNGDQYTCPYNVPDTTPATIVKFRLSSGFANLDFASSDGYNLPLSVSNSSVGNLLSCELELADCPSSNVIREAQKIVGCGRGPDTASFNKIVEAKCPTSKNVALVDGGVYTITFCPGN